MLKQMIISIVFNNVDVIMLIECSLSGCKSTFLYMKRSKVIVFNAYTHQYNIKLGNKIVGLAGIRFHYSVFLHNNS